MNLQYAKPGTSLTPREREVLTLVGKGFGYSEVARLLGISSDTVNEYMRRVCRRLEVNTRIEAAVLAAKQGWL